MSTTILPTQGSQVGVIHATAAFTLTREQSGYTITNLGASGAIEVTLPQDAKGGEKFFFNVMAAQALQVSPGAAGAIYTAGAKQTDNKHMWADDEGEHVTLTCIGDNDWVSGPVNGTWTVES